MFKGLGNLANIGALMKQAQEMGGKMQALNEELKTKRATGAAGGGLVEVDVNGLSEVLAVRIDPSLVEKGDREMIEDLLPAAFNAAQQKAKQLQCRGDGIAGRRISSPGPARGARAAHGEYTGQQFVVAGLCRCCCRRRLQLERRPSAAVSPPHRGRPFCQADFASSLRIRARLARSPRPTNSSCFVGRISTRLF